MKRLILPALLILFSSTFSSAAIVYSQDVREWKYQDNSQILEGSMIKANEHFVFIETKHRVYKMEIERLNESSQSYLQTQLKNQSVQLQQSQIADETENSDVPVPVIIFVVISALLITFAGYQKMYVQKWAIQAGSVFLLILVMILITT